MDYERKILGIYGAGGGGREILEIARLPDYTNQYKEIIFVDDAKAGQLLKGCQIRSFEEIVEQYSSNEIEIVISVGEPTDRKAIYDRVVQAGYKLATLIHPNSFITETSHLGEGVIVSYNAFVSCETTIEDNVMIQPLSIVGHDVSIGANSVISGNTSIAGGVSIGNNTYIALNVCIRERTKIGSNVIVSAGSAVLKDVPDNVIVLGNPARPIMKKDENRVFH